jgi:hypothetical protein
VERKFAARAHIKRNYHILQYYRYKDDGIIVAKFDDRGRRIRPRHFFARMGHLANFYPIVCTAVGQCVRYLNFDVSIKNERIVVTPFYEHDTIPIEASSAHHASVHSRWPHALVRSIKKLAHDDPKLYTTAVANVHKRFDLNFLRFPALSIPRNVSPSMHNCLWMSLPFHPSWFKGTVSAFHRCVSDPYMRGLLRLAYDDAQSKVVSPRIAWSNFMWNHGRVIQHSSNRKSLRTM